MGCARTSAELSLRPCNRDPWPGIRDPLKTERRHLDDVRNVVVMIPQCSKKRRLKECSATSAHTSGMTQLNCNLPLLRLRLRPDPGSRTPDPDAIHHWTISSPAPAFAA